MGEGLQAREGRTYEIRTYGCQMNAHDSERVAGLLEDAGYTRASEGDTADLIVFNTCAVRETPPTGCTATSATCSR